MVTQCSSFSKFCVVIFFLDGEASLIYSKGNSIQRLSLPPRPNDVGIIYQRPGAVHVGVDYDCVEQMVYWTEVIKGTIVRAKYDGSDMEVIVNSGKTTSPEGKINISSSIVPKFERAPSRKFCHRVVQTMS